MILVCCGEIATIMKSNSLRAAIVLVGLILIQSAVLAQDVNRPPDAALQISLENRLDVFNQAWETVDKKFFDPTFNGVNWLQVKEKYRPLAEAAVDKVQMRDVLQKMMSELHTSHMSVSGGFQFGTGVSYRQVDGQWLVYLIAPGSPAHHAGMEPGWILTGSEGDCFGLGSKVDVRLLDLREQTRSLELPCATYPAVPEAPRIVQPLEGGVVYMRFSSFTNDAGSWLSTQVARNLSAKAIVLDLRGNWGGEFDVFKKCIKHFYSEQKVIGKFRNRKGKEFTVKTGASKSAYPGRIFVLTDHYTGSAAEVFAQTIQETGRGIVVGQPSLGGVLGGEHFKIPNGFSLHIATWDYYTAKGVRLEGRGVKPDEPVDLTIKDFHESKDAVMDRVRQLLR
jgi:carboxyl-terminal processing protease